MHRKISISKFTVVAVLAISATTTPAQTTSDPTSYPTKAIRLIVPWPAGGTTDIVGRVMAQKLGESMGRNIVVDNRAGASGSVGTENMLQSPADGHTLLVSSMGTHAMNQFFYKLAFDPVADVAPLSMLVNVPAALVAHPSVSFGTVPALLNAAKARPGYLNVASGSNAYQLFLELLKSRASIKVEHIRYRGAGPAMNDLIGGQVEMLITGLPAITPHAKAGKLKVIAVTNSRRAAAMPNVPTINETVPGVTFDNWTAMFARAGTPRAIVDKLNAEATRILKLPDVQERFLGLGAEPTTSTPQALGATLKNDAEIWGKVIRDTGIKGD